MVWPGAQAGAGCRRPRFPGSARPGGTTSARPAAGQPRPALRSRPAAATASQAARRQHLPVLPAGRRPGAPARQASVSARKCRFRVSLWSDPFSAWRRLPGGTARLLLELPHLLGRNAAVLFHPDADEGRKVPAVAVPLSQPPPQRLSIAPRYIPAPRPAPRSAACRRRPRSKLICRRPDALAAAHRHARSPGVCRAQPAAWRWVPEVSAIAVPGRPYGSVTCGMALMGISPASIR